MPAPEGRAQISSEKEPRPGSTARIEVGESPYFQTVNVTIRTAGGTATLNNAYTVHDTPTISPTP